MRRSSRAAAVALALPRRSSRAAAVARAPAPQSSRAAAVARAPAPQLARRRRGSRSRAAARAPPPWLALPRRSSRAAAVARAPAPPFARAPRWRRFRLLGTIRELQLSESRLPAAVGAVRTPRARSQGRANAAMVPLDWGTTREMASQGGGVRREVPNTGQKALGGGADQAPRWTQEGVSHGIQRGHRRARQAQHLLQGGPVHGSAFTGRRL